MHSDRAVCLCASVIRRCIIGCRFFSLFMFVICKPFVIIIHFHCHCQYSWQMYPVYMYNFLSHIVHNVVLLCRYGLFDNSNRYSSLPHLCSVEEQTKEFHSTHRYSSLCVSVIYLHLLLICVANRLHLSVCPFEISCVSGLLCLFLYR